jgi:tungstate transport system ATP-binding protein
MMAEPASLLPLVLSDLVFAIGPKRLIKGVSAVLEPGPPSVILGPNGAGKTLFLKLCHGLLAPSSGSIAWSGLDDGDARTRQAMVFQRPVMLRRSVAANIDYALRLRKVPAAERRERIGHVLNRTGLYRFASQAARVLSVGEQQRLALARAWALAPEVLFLDEPTASLDPAATRSVEAIIAAIHASGAKIIMSTHDLAQARRVAHEILFLHRGRLYEQTPAEVFFAAPRTVEAAHFLEGRLLSQIRRVV